VLLAATAVYSLVSVPLALHYLSNQQFGLWTLMASIGGYLGLIDLGMSNSMARLLIDHKDEPSGGSYGGLIQTGWLVSFVQGILVLLAALGLAPLLAGLLAIQIDLQPQFISLLRWQGAAWAVNFLTRIGGHLLLAHQRFDLVNYSQLFSLAITFLSLWFFFCSGQGLMSMAWATLLASVGGGAVALLACWRLKFFPPAGAWGHPSWVRFREVFAYGKDLFLVSVGSQLIMGSQTMIITRRLGLVAAATWYTGTRALNLVNPAVWRVSDVSMPAFSEMMVRGEKVLLRERYKAVLILSASLSGFAAVAYALCNSLFVAVWIPPARSIHWPAANDVLVGLWIPVLAVLHCHIGFILMIKQIGFMRYVYFVEGLAYAGSALVLAKWGGLPAIIACSVCCSTLFTGAYGVWRVSRYFELPIREVGIRWLAPMGKVLALFAPMALTGWWVFRGAGGSLVRLALSASLSGSLGVYCFLRYGLSRPVQQELLNRAPRVVNSVLKRIFMPARQ
jgi:O-antigen/teichoic acid export membrane protein